MATGTREGNVLKPAPPELTPFGLGLFGDFSYQWSKLGGQLGARMPRHCPRAC
jgi:hypothetical protein